MPIASKIIIARQDFSIPGSPGDDSGTPASAALLESKFFDLIEANRPDVVVLDLTKGGAEGLDTIRKIRRRANAPVLVVHDAEDPQAEDYRICGAGGCLAAPIDINGLNQAIQRIMGLFNSHESWARREPTLFAFGDITFQSDEYSLHNPTGADVKLTTLESDVLLHLARNSRRVCSRQEISDRLYGNDKPTTERAIDMIVNRLRKKLAIVGGEFGKNLLKTEFRRGYVLVADVRTSAELST